MVYRSELVWFEEIGNQAKLLVGFLNNQASEQPSVIEQNLLGLIFLVNFCRWFYALFQQFGSFESLGNVRQVRSVFCTFSIDRMASIAASLFVDKFAVFNRAIAQLVCSSAKIVVLPFFHKATFPERIVFDQVVDDLHVKTDRRYSGPGDSVGIR